MAKFGSDDVTFEIDEAVGGTLTDITSHVTSFNGVNIQAILEDSTPFGVSWQEQLFSGVKAGDNVTLEGFYDDAAGGPKAIFQGGEGETRTFKVTWGSTNTTSGEVLILRFNKRAMPKETTKYTAELVYTGTITEV